MPPSRPSNRPRPSPTGAVVVLVAIVAGVALVWSTVRFASQNPEKANLGDSVFEVGRADRLAAEIDDRGPFLFQDPLSRGGGRNLYINHLGDDPDKGWLAVEARIPDEPECTITWNRERGAFVDCHGDRHGADGTGLTTYPGTVQDGQVSVDLRPNARSGER